MPKRRDDAQSDEFIVALIPDDHTPAHDPKYVDVVCRWLERRRIDALVQLGDHIDHESIGRFAKESPKKLAESVVLEEWEIAHRIRRRYVAAAKKRNPECRDYWLEGNHEFRIRKLEDRMPMLTGFFDEKYLSVLASEGSKWIPNDSAGDVLRFEQRPGAGIVSTIRSPTEVSDAMYHGFGCTHGWSYSLYSAKATADLAPWPGVMFAGHTHRVQVHTVNMWGMSKKTGVTCGWGGLPWPNYIQGRPTGWEQALVWGSLSRTMPGHHTYGIVRVLDGQIVGETLAVSK